MRKPRERHVLAALLALALLLVSRMASMALLPLTDPTEGRYAQVSQEMALIGDWVTPRVWMNEAHVPFLGKPPLYFWAAAGAMRVFGASAFAARLPSMLASVALLGLLYVVMERYGGKGSGLFSVLVTASCGFFVAVSGSVATDMVFSFCVAGSLLAYFAFTSEPDQLIRRRWSLLVFGLLALGFLTKGPAAVVLFGLPVLIWTARWREWPRLRDHRWIVGTLLFLALVMPWFALCEMRNPGFLNYFFLNENLLRFMRHDYGDAYGSGHLYPRGSALLMFFAAAAPWSLVGLWRAVAGGQPFLSDNAAGRQAGFLFLSFAVGTLFWCLARQLLFTYVLPLVPLFAAWLALVTRGEAARRRVCSFATVLVAAAAFASVACVPLLRNVSTTREIVELAHRSEGGAAGVGEPLVFEHKTPYSALFYARGWVVTHPKEPLLKTLQTCRRKWRSALVVVNSRRKGVLSALASGSWAELGTSGEWTLARVTFQKREDTGM